MASIKQRARGDWRAQVFVRGVRDSQVFRTQREAKAWAAARESELREAAARPAGDRVTMRALLERYRDEITPTKRGARWETVRIEAMLGMAELPLGRPVSQIEPEDFAAWRAARAAAVQAGSLLRELGILSAVFEAARREWRLIAINPLRDVRRPPAPPHRDTLITWSQARRMLRALGFSPARGPRSITEAVGHAFLFALQTGMRGGEICALRWDWVFDDHCTTSGKTGTRDVPLVRQARRTIERMRGFDAVLVFGVSSQTRDALFRKARERAGLSGFTFHDARHTAATRLAGRLHVLDLCKAFGWRDPKRAMTYYNPSAGEIARRINRAPGA